MAGRRRKAFTLVELLIVIIIIAVLAAVIVPRFQNSSIRAKESALRANLKSIRKAVERFSEDCGRFPAQLSDITATSAPANGINGGGQVKPIQAGSWQGPYLGGDVIDPVSGAPYTYDTSPPGTGDVKPSATGTASDGSLYSSW